ncbi:hypothetical protein GCM10017786_20200 [Amycolatopsis deserti]|uniref:Uncharacterized protein n=1 Tax=Amycolatopsis deserti TaxID=185696 RepID=A0ABQ3IQC7_9PSEU|nr:hypothetical protein [Amycolatopsis deserti]GHE88182.1 hypothetical protein GCM10017786_20200 [Amycolatopsis deserti]
MIKEDGPPMRVILCTPTMTAFFFPGPAPASFDRAPADAVVGHLLDNRSPKEPGRELNGAISSDSDYGLDSSVQAGGR